MGHDSKNDSQSKPETIQQLPRKSAERRAAVADSTLSSPFGKSRKLQEVELPRVSDELYEMRGEFARGGLGRILEAKDTRLKRIVAVKELVDNLPVSRARFAREALLTARLQHPSIIPVHEAGSWPDNKPFYTMKLVAGTSLAEAVANTDTFAQRMALVPHVINVADAIAYAHSQRIIHRDLKPANVLVGSFGETVVIDWGLAKDLSIEDDEEDAEESTASSREEHVTGGYDTSDGAVIGTPAYMPPEQASGQTVDERADVYALGALLYHVIAGKRPYFDIAAMHLLAHVENKGPRELSEVEPAAPADLVAIVDKAMSRRPQDRYATAKELAEELTRYSTGRLVDAHHYSSLDLLGRFVARHKPELYTALAAFAVLIVFGIWSVLNIQDERNKAQDSARAETQERGRAQDSAAAEKTARSAAETRANQVLVERARLLLLSDPTEAIVSLKELTEILSGAASIAAAAQERGVARAVWTHHDDQVLALAYSPDGTMVASASNAGTVVLTDTRTGEPRSLLGHTNRVRSLAFSADGARLVTGGYDKSVRVWDVATAEATVLSGHDRAVTAVAIAPDGGRVASVSDDGKARIWDVSTQREAAVIEAPVSRDPVVAFSPDGNQVAIASVRDIRVWSAQGSVRVLRGHTDDVTDVEFFPGGESLASSSRDGSVRTWGGRDRILGRGSDAILALAIAPDGQSLATADYAGSVRLWNPSSGASSFLGAHRGRATAVTFSPDGALVASSSWDKSVRLWSIQRGDRRVLDGHHDVVSAAAFSPDGRLLASGSWDGTVRLWPVKTPTQQVLRGHTIGVKTVAFSPDGNLIASGGHDDTVRIWDRATGTSRIFAGHTDNVFRVVFSPDGTRVASSSDDRTVRVWNVATGDAAILRGHTADVEELAFSPDGSQLISGAEDKTARLWDLASGQSTVLQHDDELSDVAFAPDGSFAVTATKAGEVALWRGADRTEVAGSTRGVWSVDVSADSTLIVAASADDRVHLWSVSASEISVDRTANLAGARWVRLSPNGETIGVAGSRGQVWLCTTSGLSCEMLGAHRGAIWDIEYSADSAMLATAGADTGVRVWDVATHESVDLQGHAAPIFDVAFSRDGTALASASGDGDIIVWQPRVPPPADRVRALLDELTEVKP